MKAFETLQSSKKFTGCPAHVVSGEAVNPAGAPKVQVPPKERENPLPSFPGMSKHKR